LSKETLNRTNFKYAKEKNIINLEKSLKYGSRISGHFVQGHVDATCNVNKIDIIGKSWSIKFSLSSKYRKFVVEKGSIAINGVSLTISNIFKNEFQVVVIPQTLKYTNLIKLNKKDTVNVEFDVLGKYINNSLK
jgi:riboflavin synthase